MKLKKLGVALFIAGALSPALTSSALAAAVTEDVKWWTGSGELGGSLEMEAEALGTATFTTTVAGTKYKLQSTEVECVGCKIENSSGVAVGSGS